MAKIPIPLNDSRIKNAKPREKEWHKVKATSARE